MKKLLNLLFAFALIGAFFGISAPEVQAAPPSVTFLINGGTAAVNNAGPYTLSWSSSGATRCESSGSGGNSWEYNPSLATSGTKTGITGGGDGHGAFAFVITCFNGAGEKTTVTRYANVAYDNFDCAVFPELARAEGTITVQNLTTGASSSGSFMTNGYESAPDLPASVGDTIMIQYEIHITGGDPSSTSMNGPAFRYGTSTSTVSNASQGTFIADSITSLSTVSIEGDACNANGGGISVALVQAPGNFTLSCTPASATINAGGSTSFNISTTAQNGFNSPVTVSHTFSPSSGTLPFVSYANNGQIPPAVTTATITTTQATTPANYTITFTATGGTVTKQCNVQLVVNPAPTGSYNLTVTPDNTQVLKGNNAVFTVTAVCTGTAAGPITSLAASSPFTNLTYQFSSSSVNCGSSVTLTVGNTGSISPSQFSTPQERLEQTIQVTGQGDL